MAQKLILNNTQKVGYNRLTLRLGDERVVFNLSNTLKQSSSFASCSFIESVDIDDAPMEGAFLGVGMLDPLKRVLIDEYLDWELNPEVEEILMFLHSQHGPGPPSYERLEWGNVPKLKPLIEKPPD